MGFPPPPPNGPPPPPDQGGGFGPPQGFGPPPPPPPGGYGYPSQGGDQGYGYPQQGGYGPPGPPGPPLPPGYGYPPSGGFPPPPPPPNNNKRNVGIAIGAVVVIGGIIAAVVLAGGGSGDKSPTAKDTSGTPTISGLPTGLPTDLPTDFPSGLPTDLPTDFPTDTPSLDLPTDFPSFTLDPTPTTKVVPYVVLSPGKCFNAPSLTPSVDTVTTTSCGSAHDAEVVANETLSGTFDSDQDIQAKALSLCESDARKHVPADSRRYYPYALFPKLVTYQLQGRTTVTCSLTLNDGTNGKKLNAKLG